MKTRFPNLKYHVVIKVQNVIRNKNNGEKKNKVKYAKIVLRSRLI